MRELNVERRVERHIELRRVGVLDPEVRTKIIRLEELRATDFAGWVAARAQFRVFELIDLAELEGKEMIESLTSGRGAFRRGEVELMGGIGKRRAR